MLTKTYGCIHFVPVIEGTAARREHTLSQLVSIGEMLVCFGNDQVCSQRAAPATRSAKRIHKELSNSYREGINEKLKSMAQPYKTKVSKKMSNDGFRGP